MPTYYLIAIDGQGLEGLNNAIVSYQYHEGTEFTNTGIKMIEEEVGDDVSLQFWAESKLNM